MVNKLGKLAGAAVLVLGGMLLLGLLITKVLLDSPVGHLDDAIERGLASNRTATLNTLTSRSPTRSTPRSRLVSWSCSWPC